MKSNCPVCDSSIIPLAHYCSNVDPTGELASLREKLKKAEEERDAALNLVNMAKDYMSHADDCGYTYSNSKACSCGLLEWFAEARK